MWHTETHREQKEEANLNKNTKTDSSQEKKNATPKRQQIPHIQNFRKATKPTREGKKKGKQRSKQTQQNAEIPIPETAA
jgi:hypothetical protein